LPPRVFSANIVFSVGSVLAADASVVPLRSSITCA
jgi:hypothetical protein